MLYGIIRILFGIIIFFIIFLIMKKIKFIKTKFIAILYFIIAFAICSLSFLFPVENIFINFKSPIDVFSYYQNGEVEDIIYGDNSGMVIYSKDKSLGGYFIVPKGKNGYKIPSLFSVKKIFHKLNREGSLEVYNVLGTNDYYVVGTIISKESEINIFDINNKPVKNIITNVENTDIKNIRFFSFIENYSREYYLLINQEKIYISD